MPQPNDLSRNPHRSGTAVRQTPPLLADPEPVIAHPASAFSDRDKLT